MGRALKHSKFILDVPAFFDLMVDLGYFTGNKRRFMVKASMADVSGPTTEVVVRGEPMMLVVDASSFTLYDDRIEVKVERALRVAMNTVTIRPLDDGMVAIKDHMNSTKVGESFKDL